MADNLRYLDDYVAAQITALKEFRRYWLNQTDREFYPLHMDNWKLAFETWLASQEAQDQRDPVVMQARRALFLAEWQALK